MKPFPLVACALFSFHVHAQKAPASYSPSTDPLELRTARMIMNGDVYVPAAVWAR